MGMSEREGERVREREHKYKEKKRSGKERRKEKEKEKIARLVLMNWGLPDGMVRGVKSLESLSKKMSVGL